MRSLNARERGAVWQRLGAPDEQVGSVNDPRVHEDAGVRWNEKWVYLGADGAPERAVLWYRYDLAGVFRVRPDGALEPEPDAASEPDPERGPEPAPARA